jgi:carbon-monoxide dehydrogenase catalytic subunit
MGSCVDNTRILTLLADIVDTGGLGDDIDQVPAVGISPEYYCEKALEIATYCVGSGVYVIFGGVESPVGGSEKVTAIHTTGWEEKYGGKLEFIPDWDGIFQASMAHIQKKREALGIHETHERVLLDMADRRG